MARKEKVIIEHHTAAGWQVFGSAMATVFHNGFGLSFMDDITEDMRIVHNDNRYHIGCIRVVGKNGKGLMITIEDCD